MFGVRGECVGGIVGIDAQRYHLFGKLLHELEILEQLRSHLENRLRDMDSLLVALRNWCEIT